MRDEVVASIRSLQQQPTISTEELELCKEELQLRREELALARQRAENELELRKEELKGQTAVRLEEMKLMRELVQRVVSAPPK